MSTLRGWWEEDYQQTQRYYNTILGHYGIAPTVATVSYTHLDVYKRQQIESWKNKFILMTKPTKNLYDIFKATSLSLIHI